MSKTESTFEWRGIQWKPFDHPYNATITNERAVEIPIALDFLARAEGRVLEVGNVLAHYFPADHLPPRVVVDRYEEHAAVTMPGVDVFSLVGQFDTILSISTLEHVRQDEPDFLSLPNHYGGLAALFYLRGLLAPEGRMLITLQAEHNAELDEALYDAWVQASLILGASTVRRYARFDGEWRQDLIGDATDHPVWIAEWGPIESVWAKPTIDLES